MPSTTRKKTKGVKAVATQTLVIPSTILIADKERRTMKYFLALAGGVPCLHFNWVKDCIQQVLLHIVVPHHKQHKCCSYLESVGYCCSFPSFFVAFWIFRFEETVSIQVSSHLLAKNNKCS
jgi:hypothetical protein